MREGLKGCKGREEERLGGKWMSQMQRWGKVDREVETLIEEGRYGDREE